MNIIETDRGMMVDLVLALPHGLHSRPSARLAQTARKYKANIRLIGETGEVDAKSMLDILSLAPQNNSHIQLLANGPDAREALADIFALLNNMREEHGKIGS